MSIKIGINGYGRIGRNILRAIHEYGRTSEFDVVALNDLGDPETNAHLTRFDTAHGPFAGEVQVDGGDIIVNGDRVKVFAERDPAKLPWGELGVDYVVESSGQFRRLKELEQHLAAGGACLALLNAALAMGWGANWLTGWPVFDRHFVEAGLGLNTSERVAGIIHIGTERNAPPERPRPDIDAITEWIDA